MRYPFSSLLFSGLTLFSLGARADAAHAPDSSVQRVDTNTEASAQPDLPPALIGVWTLERVDNVYPEGRRVELYGPHPQGLWIIDAQGHYMMQMVRAQRAGFAANDKAKGTPEEYRAAAMDSNAHYGRIRADATTLHTHIEHASFPNWDGRDSDSAYTLKGDELSYIVAKPSSGAGEGAHGEVVWRRLR